MTTSGNQPVVDASVHVFFQGNREIRDWLLEPFKSRGFPDYEMLTGRWLDDEVYGERFRGTIRVNPDDIEGALKEIERWSAHPRMVQIGVPLQSREVYGKPQYWPLWEEAARRGLPVAVHIET